MRSAAGPGLGVMDTPFDTRAQRWRNRAKLLYLRPWWKTKSRSHELRLRWAALDPDTRRAVPIALAALFAWACLFVEDENPPLWIAAGIAFLVALHFLFNIGVHLVKNDERPDGSVEEADEFGVPLRRAFPSFFLSFFVGLLFLLPTL